eukprot:TRINITY_DN6398_c0_g1_i3.p1 TRINITY_DN6398_c0_g1~~TRINITY_DN6398_c0_g1_i3.p1  ORF type:complete len:556 (+),score=58.13 TRINITY_DN6398_c0_g1_i3:791-2458(+)
MLCAKIWIVWCMHILFHASQAGFGLVVQDLTFILGWFLSGSYWHITTFIVAPFAASACRCNVLHLARNHPSQSKYFTICEFIAGCVWIDCWDNSCWVGQCFYVMCVSPAMDFEYFSHLEACVEATFCNYNSSILQHQIATIVDAGTAFRPNQSRSDIDFPLLLTDQELTEENLPRDPNQEHPTDIDILISEMQALMKLEGLVAGSMKSAINSSVKLLEKANVHLLHAFDPKHIARAPSPMIEPIYEAMCKLNPDSLTAELDERCMHDLEKCREAQSKSVRAAAEGEVAIMESQTLAALGHFESVLSTLKAKAGLLDSEVSWCRKFPIKLVAQQKRIEPELLHLREHAGIMLGKVNNDVCRLQTAWEHKRTVYHKQATSNAKWWKESDNRLQDLVARQDELWERIQEAERAVRRVTMQHVQELRNRAERGVIAALAENEWTAFDNFCNQRMRDLNEARETCDAQLRVADILVDCVRGLVEGSIKGIAGVSANLIMDAQIKTLNTYSHVYHDQHLMLGEFIFRREQALTELKSKLEIAAINLELTGETLDPLAKKTC